MITDAVRGKTVGTFSGGGTRCLTVQTVAVRRGCDVADSGDGFFGIYGYLVHAAYKNDIGWTEDEGSNPVAVAIDIYQFSIQSDGIGAHKVIITGKCLTVDFLDFFWCGGFGAVIEGNVLSGL